LIRTGYRVYLSAARVEKVAFLPTFFTHLFLLTFCPTFSSQFFAPARDEVNQVVTYRTDHISYGFIFAA